MQHGEFKCKIQIEIASGVMVNSSSRLTVTVMLLFAEQITPLLRPIALTPASMYKNPTLTLHSWQRTCCLHSCFILRFWPRFVSYFTCCCGDAKFKFIGNLWHLCHNNTLAPFPYLVFIYLFKYICLLTPLYHLWPISAELAELWGWELISFQWKSALSLFCEIVNLMVSKRAQEWKKYDPNTSSKQYHEQQMKA